MNTGKITWSKQWKLLKCFAICCWLDSDCWHKWKNWTRASPSRCHRWFGWHHVSKRTSKSCEVCALLRLLRFQLFFNPFGTVIADLLTSKYGKPFAEVARTATGDHMVSVKLMHKLAIQAPPKILVEKYPLLPPPSVRSTVDKIRLQKFPDIWLKSPTFITSTTNPIHRSWRRTCQVVISLRSLLVLPYAIWRELWISDGVLIDLSDRNNLGGGGGGGSSGGSGGMPQPPGFIGYPQAPVLPAMPTPPKGAPFNYPNMGNNNGSGSGGATAPPFNYNIPPNQEKKDLNINTQFLNVSFLSFRFRWEGWGTVWMTIWVFFWVNGSRRRATFILHPTRQPSVQTIIFR